jgi:hypothetical protein
MSPTCCILSLPGPLSVPGLQFYKDNVSLDAASSLVFTALAAKAQPAQAAAPAQAWLLPLQELASAHRVERGSAAELSAYQALVKRQIEVALEGVAGEQPLGLSEQLQKALRLVNAGKTSQGHALAVELLGFAGLAGLAAVSGKSRQVGCLGWAWSSSSFTVCFVCMIQFGCWASRCPVSPSCCLLSCSGSAAWVTCARYTPCQLSPPCVCVLFSL